MFPSSAAVNVHVPDATIVTVVPDTVHTLVVDDVTVGISPEVAETVTPKVDADQVLVPGSVNEIVFDALAIVTVSADDDLDEKLVSPAFVAVTLHVAPAFPVAVSMAPETEHPPEVE